MDDVAGNLCVSMVRGGASDVLVIDTHFDASSLLSLVACMTRGDQYLPGCIHRMRTSKEVSRKLAAALHFPRTPGPARGVGGAAASVATAPVAFR